MGHDEKLPSWYWRVSAALIGAGVLLVTVGAFLEPGTPALIATVALGSVGLLVIAVQFARAYRNAPNARLRHVLVVLVIVGGILWGLRWVWHRPDVTVIECLGTASVAAGMLHALSIAFLCRRSADALRSDDDRWRRGSTSSASCANPHRGSTTPGFPIYSPSGWAPTRIAGSR